MGEEISITGMLWWSDNGQKWVWRILRLKITKVLDLDFTTLKKKDNMQLYDWMHATACFFTFVYI